MIKQNKPTISEDPFNYLLNNTKINKTQLIEEKIVKKHQPWLILCDIGNYNRILVIGSIIDFSLIELIKYFNEIYVIDTNKENKKILKAQVEYHSINNIKFKYGLDGSSLTFENEYFDAIYLNPIVVQSSHINTYHKYLDLLKEIKRILKPNGCLYIEIENYFSYRQNFKQLQINHLRDKIGLIWNVLNNLIKCNSSECINSSFRYKNILLKSGFTNIRLYSLYPALAKIQEITDIKYSGYSSITSLNIKEIKKKIKNNKFFLKLFSPAFAFVVNNTPHSSNNIEKIIYQINNRNKDDYKLLSDKYIINEKGTLVFRLKDSIKNQKIIIKTALTKSAYNSLSNNMKALSFFHKNIKITKEIKDLVPKVKGTLYYKKHYYFAEELKLGNPATSFKNDQNKLMKILNNSGHIIEQINLSTISVKKENKLIKQNIINEKIKFLGDILGYEANLIFLRKLKDYLLDNLLSNKIPMVFKKGDFSANNVLVDDKQSIKALIDWDEYKLNFFPMIDLINIIESIKRHHLNKSLGEIVSSFFHNEFAQNEYSLISHYCDIIGIPIKLTIPLSIIYWLEQGYFGKQNFELVKYNKKWVNNNIYQVVSALDKLI